MAFLFTFHQYLDQYYSDELESDHYNRDRRELPSHRSKRREGEHIERSKESICASGGCKNVGSFCYKGKISDYQ